MTSRPLAGCRIRTAELVLLRFCPPGPLARYVSTSHCASSCSSVRVAQAERDMGSGVEQRPPLAAHRPAQHLVAQVGVLLADELLPGRVPLQPLAAQPLADHTEVADGDG